VTTWNLHANDLFLAALDRPAGPERDRYLDAACAGDPGLRAEVDSLLAAAARAGGFLEVPAAGVTVDLSPTADRAGATIGPYKLLQPLGEGGMGAVWMADQAVPVRRKVAVKLIKPGMDSKSVLARFEAERQALALMDHPNIAKVFDAGTTAEGRPYFVMELVKGVPITQYCDERKLTPRERLELFVPVCQAVQHAHQKGVIHRDLKPSNVLVAQFDGRPVPKVIDFGVAKAVAQDLTGRTLFTEVGQVVGTLEYMSPEQAELNQLDVDTRSDVYALGVLLYELLTGSTPLERRRLKAAAMAEVLRLIREEDPPRPSARLSESRDALPAISAQRQTEPARLTRLVRGDLDWIAMKALEKDRARRYETALGLAQDVERFLVDQPVLACPPSAAYRVRKFVRRNRVAVFVAGLTAGLLAAGAAGTAVGLVRALAAERRAVADRDAKEIARQQAAAAAATATEARRHARRSLNPLTDEVTEDLLGRQAEITDQHREFLRKVLAEHAAFAAAPGDDPEGRESRAEGAFRVARIQFRLGESKEAEAAYREARDRFAQLADEFPERPEFRGNQAAAGQGLGILLRDAGRNPEAEMVFRDALLIQTALVGELPGEREYRKQLASTQVNLGILLSEAGRRPEAEPVFREALDVWKRLTADDPKQPDFAQGLAFAQNNLATLLSATDRPDEAETVYREALDIRRRLAREYPGRVEYRKHLALSLNNLGVLYRVTGYPEKAVEPYREALAIRKKLAADFPSRPDLRDDLGQSHGNMGNLLRKLGRQEAAENAFKDALAIRKQLVADFPDRPDFRQRLGHAHNNLGVLLADIKRPADAEGAYGEALAVRERLEADYPAVPAYKDELSGVLGNMANLHNDRKEFAAALPLIDRAVVHSRAAMAAEPKNPLYVRTYWNNRYALATSALGLGDHARLATAASDFARSGYDKSDAYFAVRWLLKCIALVDKDAKLPEARRRELAQAYGDQAIAHIPTAVANRGYGLDDFKTLPEFDPLRSRADFKRVLAELEAKAKEPKQ
jgi:serine/threonine protein kinase/tetratricopeptide (TPR) repeat protein